MKIVIIILLVSIVNLSFAQTPIKVLIGSTDQEVRSYLQSVIDRSDNSSYLKIEPATDDGGDLILKLSLPMTEETKLGCLDIWLKFTRVKGSEVCYMEGVFGSVTNAQTNLNFVKDNYDYVSSGVWRQKDFYSKQLGVEVTYKRQEQSYLLTYLLRSTK